MIVTSTVTPFDGEAGADASGPSLARTGLAPATPSAQNGTVRKLVLPGAPMTQVCTATAPINITVARRSLGQKASSC
jgi:hypothetical protein